MDRSQRAQLLASLLGLAQLTGCTAHVCTYGGGDRLIDGNWIGSDLALAIGATESTDPCGDRETLIEGIGFKAQPGFPWDRMAFSGRGYRVVGHLWSTAGDTAPQLVAAFNTKITREADSLSFQIAYTPGDGRPQVENYVLQREAR